jgi:hypothetical protein
MKVLGVNWIISVSAVGTLQDEIPPGHVVLVDQYIDRTTKVLLSIKLELFLLWLMLLLVLMFFYSLAYFSTKVSI